MNFLLASLLVSLRLAPALAFAPPFTLMSVPASVRVLLGIGLSLWLVDARPGPTSERISELTLSLVAGGELLLGLAIALGLQLVFAGILWAGRALDIQAGFGLAMLADPTTNAQLPLAGAILAYAAGMVFFASGAQYDLIALWVASVEILPLGHTMDSPHIVALGTVLSSIFFVSIGLVAASMLAMFMADLVIAFLSRTLPQMNVLLLGFQVKAMLMLLTLPISVSYAAAKFLQLVRISVTSPATFWGN